MKSAPGIDPKRLNRYQIISRLMGNDQKNVARLKKMLEA